MASTSTSTASLSTIPPSPPPSRKITPTSQPIPILPTPLAQTYTHIHPFLLLTLYYIRFPSLAASPVSTLLSSLLPLSALQIAWVTTCLPAHSHAKSAPQAREKKTTAAQGLKRRPTPKGNARDGWSAKIIPALLSLLLTAFLALPFLTVLMILFGAPLTTHLPHTALCAAHIALLAVLPLFYVHGVDARMWREISGGMLAFDGVWGGTVGTILGAWLGAIPIPLDWDREWQKWPVTIVTGAYIGWFVGRYAGMYWLREKRIEFD